MEGIKKRFELLSHITSRMSKRNQEIPWKSWPQVRE